MPDFYVEMNRIGTILHARKLKPTEDYPIHEINGMLGKCPKQAFEDIYSAEYTIIGIKVVRRDIDLVNSIKEANQLRLRLISIGRL